jgi:hypothetical protein
MMRVQGNERLAVQGNGRHSRLLCVRPVVLTMEAISWAACFNTCA